MLSHLHHSRQRTLLTASLVRRRLISTSSSSDTSTPASRPPPDVSLPSFDQLRGYDNSHWGIDLIYKCGGIDKRTIEKFEKVRTFVSFTSIASTHPAIQLRPVCTGLEFWLITLRGNLALVGLCGFLRASAKPDSALCSLNAYDAHALHSVLNMSTLATVHNANSHCRKLPNSARVPSSTRGCSTS